MDGSSLIQDKMYRPSLKQNTASTFIHPEEEGSFKVNQFLANTKFDLNNIDIFINQVGDDTNSLLKSTIDRLDNVKNKLILEKERLQDIIILCNKYTDFEKTMNLKADDFTGDFQAYNENTFHLPTTTSIKKRIKFRDILGNGYEGNKYVYDTVNKTFLDTTLNTATRGNMTDGSLATYWEYSRITASDYEKYVFPEVNFDSEEAKCTLDIQAEDKISELKIYSTNDNIVLSEILVSNDGKNYEDLFVKDVAINSKEELYQNPSYIYGSGVIGFKPSQFIKVTFESKGYVDNNIAFNRKELDKDGTITSDILTEIKSAKRHVIAINDLEASKTTFNASGKLVSKELITDESVSVIALHCNTFIPKELNNSAIRYFLTVNGKDYEVAPVNSHINKTKIIRFSNGTMKNNHTEYLNEKIKSAKLTILLNGKSDITPYINNIKILVGDEQ